LHSFLRVHLFFCQVLWMFNFVFSTSFAEIIECLPFSPGIRDGTKNFY